MSDISQSLKLLLNLNTVQTLIVKKFDARLSAQGITLSEYMILFHLSKAADERLRRTDLSEKIGLTASGITRLLSPLEKLGLVRKEADGRDARVSYVKLSNAGKKVFSEATISAEGISEQIMNPVKTKKPDELLKLLLEMGGTIA